MEYAQFNAQEALIFKVHFVFLAHLHVELAKEPLLTVKVAPMEWFCIIINVIRNVPQIPILILILVNNAP